jgi:hypothetical protein
MIGCVVCYRRPCSRAEQFVSPFRVLATERRVGVFAVADLVDVPPLVAALIEHGLEIERDIPISLSEWNGDRGQALEEGDTIVLELRRLPAPAYARGVGCAMAVCDAVEGGRQDPVAGANQVDLDEVDAPRLELLLLLEVQLEPGTWDFVRRFQDLDHSHHAAARSPVQDLDEPLPRRLAVFQRAAPSQEPRGLVAYFEYSVSTRSIIVR